MFLKEYVDILTTLCLGALYTFKMWLDEYFLNSWKKYENVLGKC